jgi:thiol-disulfide isomerase/thioredoxin
MRAMVLVGCGLGLMVVALALTRQLPRAAPPTATDQTPGDGVWLQSVNYSQLVETIHQHRGKVVLVDFWADYCPPCKRNLPHIIALHRQYAQRGLAVVTVSLDDAREPGQRDRVLGFLRQQQADCLNLLLDEPVDVWQRKLNLDGPPCLFVFDRAGVLRLRITDEQFDTQAFDRRVVELLGP